MFVPRWMHTRPSRGRPSSPRLIRYPAWRAARAPTKPGIREATRKGARNAWTQSLATGTGPGGVNGRVMPMKPTCCPSRTIGRTVSTARKVEPSFRMRVTSSSNFPFSTASLRRRGTSVGTFLGTWNIATDILPMTSSCVHPNRSAASAAYSWTMPCVSHVMTEVLDSKGCAAIESASERVSGTPRRFQGMRHPHEADLLPVPIHRADREARAEDVAVLSSQRHLFLELASLDRLLQETRDEGRHVLRKMERGHAQLPDDLRGRPAEQLTGVRRVLLHDPLHVARDDGRLGVECLLRHWPLQGNRGATRISEFWFTCQPYADEAPRAHRAHVAPRRPRDPERPLLPPQPVRPSPAVIFRAPANECPDRPRASEGPVQRRGHGPAGSPRKRPSGPGCPLRTLVDGPGARRVRCVDRMAPARTTSGPPRRGVVRNGAARGRRGRSRRGSGGPPGLREGPPGIEPVPR